MWRRSGAENRAANDQKLPLKMRPRRVSSSTSSPIKVSSLSTTMSAYRTRFTCENTGKFHPSSKRRLQWFFGLANVEEESHNHQQQQEEHDIQVVWSLKSGKTRILWNRRDISHFFRVPDPANSIDLAWKSRSGVTFQIQAHATAPRDGQLQYDLRVGGVSFQDLPTLQEMNRRFRRRPSGSSPEASLHSHHHETRDDSSEHRHRRRISSTSLSERSVGGVSTLSARSPNGALEFRLSMAGLHQQNQEEVVDELHSGLYTPMIESVRHQMMECLPQTEDMMSRAIVSAFMERPSAASSGSDSSRSTDLSEALPMDPMEVETNAVWEAYEWASLHGLDYYSSRAEAQEAALTFMQTQMEAIIVHLRYERLADVAAARTLLSVGAVLGLCFANSIPSDTILLDFLDKSTTREQICSVLSEFGEVKDAAMISGGGFALCRFCDEESTREVERVSAEQNGLFIEGAKAKITVVQEDSSAAPDSSFFDFHFEENKDDEDEDGLPLPTPQVSDTPSVPHLMGAYLSSDVEVYETGRMRSSEPTDLRRESSETSSEQQHCSVSTTSHHHCKSDLDPLEGNLSHLSPVSVTKLIMDGGPATPRSD